MSTEANRNYLLMSLMLQVHNVLLTRHADEKGLLREICSKLALPDGMGRLCRNGWHHQSDGSGRGSRFFSA